MSCCNSSTYSSSCCSEVPYPSISSESVPSLVDNLVYALYGTINKSISAGRVVWNIPCDPATTPAEVPSIPRQTGEGLLCYIIRVFQNSVAVIPNVVQTDTLQTITGQKTFTQKIIGDIIGDIYASNGTTKILENGTGANALFTGDVTGNITGNVIGNVTGNVTGSLSGNVTGSLSGNATTATSAATLTTPRTIAISGAVTGTATSFNGASNISIPAIITSGATIDAPVFTGTATGPLTVTGGFVGNLNGSLTNGGSMTLGTVTSATGANIDFTGIPSWVKKIIIGFDNVSTNGTSFPLIQIGSGSIANTGYTAFGGTYNSITSQTTGFPIGNSMAAASVVFGHGILTLVGSNKWLYSSIMVVSGIAFFNSNGAVTIGGSLNMLRVTTVNGIDAYDSGSIRLIYEG